MNSAAVNVKECTQMNLFVKQRQSHGHSEQTDGFQGDHVVGGMERELGVNRCFIYRMDKQLGPV